MKKSFVALLLLTTYQVTYANEAVTDSSGKAFFQYLYSDIDSDTNEQSQKGNSRANILAGQLTLPVMGTKYLGANLGLSYIGNNFDYTTHRKTSRFNHDGVNKTSNINADIFLRDSNIGGLLVGYNAVHSTDKADYDLTGSLLGSKSGSISETHHMEYYTVRGEYYFKHLTAALSYNRNQERLFNSDTLSAESKIYWDENNIISLGISQQNKTLDLTGKFNRNSNSYDVGFESRPSLFNNALRIGANYNLVEDTRNSSSYFAEYSFDNATLFNTQPTVGISYDIKNNFADTLSITIGFALDSKISLKDRDRKYLFQK